MTIAQQIELLDDKSCRLAGFRFDRRECPSCHGVLDQPKPVQPGTCVVCRSGKIKDRKLADGLCPVCHTGYRRIFRQQAGRASNYCPICRFGVLQQNRRSVPWAAATYCCSMCRAKFLDQKGSVTHSETAEVRSWQDWIEASNRPETTARCDGCHSQFDSEPSGEWTLVHNTLPRKPKYQTLTWLDWNLVATGQPPGTGNAECDECGADYDLHDRTYTLLRWHEDPYRIAARLQSVSIAQAALPWVAAGKTSAISGLVCAQCQTEFDLDGDNLHLVFSDHAVLRNDIGQTYSMANWHRVAQELPLVGHEADLENALNAAVYEGLKSGDLPFDSHAGRFWHGEVHLAGSTKHTGAQLSEDDFRTGGLTKKALFSLDSVAQVEVLEQDVSVELRDGSSIRFSVAPSSVTVPLKSGKVRVDVDAQVLGRILQRAALAHQHS